MDTIKLKPRKRKFARVTERQLGKDVSHEVEKLFVASGRN